MNKAALTIVAINEVNTVGAPSYTSGVQKWNGAAETLNAIENIRSNNPAINKTDGVTSGFETLSAIASIEKEPELP